MRNDSDGAIARTGRAGSDNVFVRTQLFLNKASVSDLCSFAASWLADGGKRQYRRAARCAVVV